MKRLGYTISGVDAIRADWRRIYDILHKDVRPRERYRHWLLTGDGVEAFPSNPLKK